MKQHDYSQEYRDSINYIVHYYGFTVDPCPKVNTKEIESVRQRLESAYQMMRPGEEDATIIKTLGLLVYIIRAQPQDNRPYTAEFIKVQMRRRDLLRLYILCNTTRTGDTIIIKNRSRSFRLHNDTNWFVADLVKPFIEKELGKMTAHEAASELENASTRNRGRRAKDPQMLKLIWGTYRFLSDRLKFRTPMPNALCNFIIKLLQMMDVLSDNTEIDAFWIRAQLRYMATRRKEEGPSPAK